MSTGQYGINFYNINDKVMKKVIILGTPGILGHIVYVFFKDLGKYELTYISYPHKLRDSNDSIDLSDQNAVRNYIKSEQPDVLINCAAVLIQESIQNPAKAIFINSFLPHFLSDVLHESGGRLIHKSTDCVFSGMKGPYTESDFPDETSIYGRSKALGEINNATDLTIRTSIVGPDLNQKGDGLFNWFMHQKGHIKGYTKAFWSGLSALEMARAFDAAIEQNITGLYHLAPAEKISKYELLLLFKKIWHCKDIEIEPYESKIVDKSLVSNRTDFVYMPPSYEPMLMELENFMLTRKSIYSHYYV